MAPDETRHLSRTKQRALVALLEGHSITRAAQEVGVTRQTVSGWMNHDRAFGASLEQVRQWLIQRTRQEVEAAAITAVASLLEVLNDPKASARSRVRAAAAILDKV